MSTYLLIRGSEDGEPCDFMDDISDLLNKPEDYGVERFLDYIPLKDPNYWIDGEALLLKVEILVPSLVATRFKLD